jgi:hypothetical protein
MIPQISKGAHFGGGLAGLLVAVPLHYQRYGRGWQRWLAAAGVALVPALSLAALVVAENRDPKWQLLVAREKAQHELEKEPREQEKVPEGQQKEAPPALRDYQRKAKAVDDETDKFYTEHVKELFDTYRPERRPEGLKKEALEGLVPAIRQLGDTTDLLTRSGPDSDPQAEAARQVAHEYFKEKTNLFRMAKDYLEAGKDDKEVEWAQQNSKVKELRKRWRELIK